MSDGQDPSIEEAEPARRDFLTLVTVTATGVAAASFAWPFLDSLGHAGADAQAAPVEVDLSTLSPGQQLVTAWGGKPVFVLHRGPEALAALRDPALEHDLRDPHSAEHQQPSYATNWHRSISPEYGVLLGVCTHLGCVPRLAAAQGAGGYVCPCHGSRFDLAGRVVSGSPALYNLPVPPYRMLSATRLRIGDNPDDPGFALDSIRQL